MKYQVNGHTLYRCERSGIRSNTYWECKTCGILAHTATDFKRWLVSHKNFRHQGPMDLTDMSCDEFIIREIIK